MRRAGTYLVCQDQSTHKYPLARPLFKRNLQMRLGPVDVDKGDKEHGDLHFSLVQDVVDKVEEVGVSVVARQ